MKKLAGKKLAGKKTVTRFAPSPTGRLHLGHAFSAMLAHDFARARGGDFLLRIEDIDPGRSRVAFVDGIVEDLRWLGLEFDGEVVRQSERLPLYAQALDGLRARGLVYPCFCTRAAIAAEIAASAAAPHGPDGPIYPGTCRALAPEEAEQRRTREPHAWRLDMAASTSILPGTGRGTARASERWRGQPEEGAAFAASNELAAPPLTWTDHGRPVPADPRAFGDVVLARKDAPTSYHLAVTIDDAAQGITDIVRGQDLYAATHVHRLLQALLGLPSPIYHHHRLIADAQGRRLAKRHGAPTMASLRAAGVDPAALVESLRANRFPAGYSAAAT